MATAKKVTKVGGDDPTPRQSAPSTSSENKGKAKQLRLFAILSWILAIVAEAGAIFVLLKSPKPIETNTWIWLIALIVADLIFVIVGSLLWKKSNRYDPASRKDKVKFFIQNQLGVIIAAIAFLPLIVLIFANKDLTGNQKKILGGIGIIAVLIAGIVGIDFDPPSLEDQAGQLSDLTGGNHVFWTKSGTRYHIYDDCQYINTDRTDEIFQGTVSQARELKNITELCKTCENKARKQKGTVTNDLPESEDNAFPETSESILNTVTDFLGN